MKKILEMYVKKCFEYRRKPTKQLKLEIEVMCQSILARVNNNGYAEMLVNLLREVANVKPQKEKEKKK